MAVRAYLYCMCVCTHFWRACWAYSLAWPDDSGGISAIYTQTHVHHLSMTMKWRWLSGACRTVTQWRWSNNQLFMRCYEKHARGHEELPYLVFVCHHSAPWSPPDRGQVPSVHKHSIRYSWETWRMPKHCGNTFLRAPPKLNLRQRGWNYFGEHSLW